MKGKDLIDKIKNNEIGEIIEKSFDNPLQMNKNLNGIKNSPQFNSEEKKLIENLRYISYKLRSFDQDKIEKLSFNFLTNFNKFQKNEAIKYSEQLTFRQYGELKEVYKAFTEIENFKLPENNRPRYAKLREMMAPLKDKFAKLEEEIINHDYRSGDIIMFEFNRENDIRNSKLDIEEGLTKRYISDYSHAGQLVSREGKLHISDVYEGYRNKEVVADEIMYSDIYRFDITKIMSKESKEKAEAKYGESWQEKVNEVFSLKQRELHSQEDKVISNSTLRRFKAGIADFIPFGHWSFSQDFKDLRDQIYNKGAYRDNIDQEYMICSEFVTKSTIASLVETQEYLNEDLSVIESIEFPFSTRENLAAVHPQRLINLLTEKGCIEMLPRPKIQAMMFQDISQREYSKMVRSIHSNVMRILSQNELNSAEIDQEKLTNTANQLIDTIIEQNNKHDLNRKIKTPLTEKEREELQNLLKPDLSDLVQGFHEQQSDLEKYWLIYKWCTSFINTIKKCFGVAEEIDLDMKEGLDKFIAEINRVTSERASNFAQMVKEERDKNQVVVERGP